MSAKQPRERNLHNWITPTQYAEMTGLSYQTVMRYVRSGVLDSYQAGPRKTFIDPTRALNG